MRKFWGFYDNGQFKVGCNGATVYIYDVYGKELDKIKELPHTYTAAFMPYCNIVALKSTDGYLGFYDLAQQKILKKHRVSTIGAQDEGMIFSTDGTLFYNIEKPCKSTRTQLAIYETATFSKVKTLFSDERKMVIVSLENDVAEDCCYVLGFMRNDTNGAIDYGFIGLLDLDNEEIIQKKPIKPYEIAAGVIADYDYIQAYKSWEARGFTEKSLEWSWFHYHHIDNPLPVSLKQLYAISK